MFCWREPAYFHELCLLAGAAAGVRGACLFCALWLCRVACDGSSCPDLQGLPWSLPIVCTPTVWLPAGDRYLLKLFRDFVFHQVTEEGAPVLEWGHVVEALNKLDAGVPEKVVLMSRDEASMMVVSYADLRRCLDSAYTELKTRANAAKRNRLGHHR